MDPNHARWFAEEVYAHDSSLKAYLRNAFPRVRDVDDVVQESYLRIWFRHLARPITSTKGFLFQVARNLARDILRHESRSPFNPVVDFASLAVMEDRPGIAEQAALHEEINILVAAIDSLPSRCRQVFILRKLQGLSQRDIAQRLDISEKTVEVQIGRASRRCERFLRSRWVTGGTL